MAMDRIVGSERTMALAAALAAELARQGVQGVDIAALADAAGTAIEHDVPTTLAEGKSPEDLNADNDG